MTSNTELWVQCATCQKFRCVPDTMRIDRTQPWFCKYNVFSTTHNTCAAPQETMPAAEDDAAAAAATPPNTRELVQEVLSGYEHARDEMSDASALFTPSTCTCSLCTEMNAAVTGWDNMSDHHVPLVQSVIDAISRSVSRAEAIEKDKRFVYAPGKPDIPRAK